MITNADTEKEIEEGIWSCTNNKEVCDKEEEKEVIPPALSILVSEGVGETEKVGG